MFDATIQTLVIYGDSISTQSYGDGGYQAMLASQLSIQEVYNHAVSASGLSTSTPDNLVDILNSRSAIHPQANLILLWHGTNDWYWGSPIGEQDSRKEETFHGALGLVVQKLHDTCPKAEIFIPTPLFRFEAPDQMPSPGPAFQTANRLGYTLADYETAILSAAGRLGFTPIPMRPLTGFTYETASFYQPDYVHPSKAGFKIIASIFSQAISGMPASFS